MISNTGMNRRSRFRKRIRIRRWLAWAPATATAAANHLLIPSTARRRDGRDGREGSHPGRKGKGHTPARKGRVTPRPEREGSHPGPKGKGHTPARKGRVTPRHKREGSYPAPRRAFPMILNQAFRVHDWQDPSVLLHTLRQKGVPRKQFSNVGEPPKSRPKVAID
jgi:hypothetical protein